MLIHHVTDESWAGRPVDNRINYYCFVDDINKRFDVKRCAEHLVSFTHCFLLIPDPYVAVALNGTFYAADPITDTKCVDLYAADFKDSFKMAVSAATDAMGRGQLCVGVNDVTLVAGSVVMVTYTNMVSILLREHTLTRNTILLP